MNKRTVIATLLVVLVAAGAALVVHRLRAIARLPTPRSVPVSVATALVRAGEVADFVQTMALIQADHASTVTAQVTGVVLEVRGREGDPVAKGQLLARIDARVLQDAVEAARARLTAADEDLHKQETIFQRDGSLFASHDIAQQAFDISRAQLEASRAGRVVAQRALESALTARAYADVTAPYAGVITARLVESGDLATTGKPLFALQELQGRVRVVSKVAQDVLARLKIGSAVTFSSGGLTLAARVSRIFPSIDAARLGLVETNLEAAPFGLPSGATLAATYLTSPVSGTVVPTASLLEGINETLVIRVRDGLTEAIPVSVGARGSSEATVVGSLVAGETLVLGLPSELMTLAGGVRVATGGR